MQKKPAPAQPVSDVSPGLRRYLYLTAAVTGAVILIVEILGAKMLSPYFGTSHFVWTAQIAVTLVSLAAGYWFGGWLVDRSQKLHRLYFCILGAALYLATTIAFCEPVAYACLRFKLAAGSVLASLFLFFVPLTLLAAVGPFVIRVMTSSVSVVGGQVGRLSAISTLGSVLGTVLIGYVLLPFLPNSVTMYITAGVLVAVASGYFVVAKQSQQQMTATVLVALTALLGYGGVRVDNNPNYILGTQIERRNSDFGLLQVLESQSRDTRYYLNDYLTQNTYDPETKKSVSLFTYMLHGLARVYTSTLDDVLCIGLGVGIAPMNFARDGAKVDAVEINPAVVPLAAKHFGLEPDKLNIIIGDGRYHLNATDKKYDAVVLDAFLGDSSPSHLMTREAFAAMQEVLKPGGVLVINSFGDFSPGRDFFTASLDKTLKAVFKSVRIHHSGGGNVFFVASDRAPLEFEREPDVSAVHPSVQWEAETAYRRIGNVNSTSGMVLTDDYNPVEFYDAANRESTRQYLARNMRRPRGD
ncbi:MAG: fused MFS/spermidine synthase [Verrucomicrobiota bacterium]